MDSTGMRAMPRIAASPRARRALKQHGLDPTRLAGSGPSGRIIEADVLNAVQAGNRPARPSGQSARQIIAERTTAAWLIPQFHLRAEADVTDLLGMRQRLVTEAEASGRLKPTLTDFLVRAQGMALRQSPAALGIWKQNEVQRLEASHVGLVVSLPESLLVPTLQEPGSGGFEELVQRRSEAVGLARSGRLSSNLMLPASTSLSNLGASRVDEFTAILFPPQSTILAAGRIAPRPVAGPSGQLLVRQTIRLVLTVDHRVLDGQSAAEFLTRIVEFLENPNLLVK